MCRSGDVQMSGCADVQIRKCADGYNLPSLRGTACPEFISGKQTPGYASQMSRSISKGWINCANA